MEEAVSASDVIKAMQGQSFNAADCKRICDEAAARFRAGEAGEGDEAPPERKGISRTNQQVAIQLLHFLPRSERVALARQLLIDLGARAP